MHMSDALLNPPVGGAMWAASASVMAFSAARMRRDVDSARVPLMGVLAAFVFAGQMINFTIPGTGSSGHLGGGIILAALLGAPSGFLAMASILTVQALFFADGGLLALGCNIFNLGFLPAFVAYPLLFRPLAGREPTQRRLFAASLVAALAGLQLGALAVILQTVASGVSDLPFGSFAALMLPIHLAIAVIEGFVTAAVISFVWKARPEVLSFTAGDLPRARISRRKLVAIFVAAGLVVGGGLSWFASSNPDGLEWSIARITGKEEIAAPDGGVHAALEKLGEKTTLLPEYGFRDSGAAAGGGENNASSAAGSSVAGIIGGLLTLLIAAGAAFLVKGKAPGPSGQRGDSGP